MKQAVSTTWSHGFSGSDERRAGEAAGAGGRVDDGDRRGAAVFAALAAGVGPSRDGGATGAPSGAAALLINTATPRTMRVGSSREGRPIKPWILPK